MAPTLYVAHNVPLGRPRSTYSWPPITPSAPFEFEESGESAKQFVARLHIRRVTKYFICIDFVVVERHKHYLMPLYNDLFYLRTTFFEVIPLDVSTLMT